MNATLLMPARDEAKSIHRVVSEIREHFVGPIIVVDNGSADGTAERASEAGAIVVGEPRAGYGRACMAGVAAAPGGTEAFVFMDADGSDRPEDIPALLAALDAGADLALGVRRGPNVAPGSIAPAARFGNWLSGILIGIVWRRRLHDLSPLKAIRANALHSLNLQEQTYGWTVEMLAKAARDGLTIVEVEAGYRHRAAGKSKVSGNLRASAKAGCCILRTIAAVAVTRRMAGMAAGGLTGVALLCLLSGWLLSQGPSSPRVLATVWIVAWPVVLISIGAGMAVAAVTDRTTSGAPRS